MPQRYSVSKYLRPHGKIIEVFGRAITACCREDGKSTRTSEAEELATSTARVR
jgi:hypothetical protein